MTEQKYRAVVRTADGQQMYGTLTGIESTPEEITATFTEERIERPVPTTDEPTCTCGHIMDDHDLSETGECQVAIPWCPCMKATDQPSLHSPTREQIAPLPADARMDAYYYGFDRTGVGFIDAILSAVAIAGKGAHHTESWGAPWEGTTDYFRGHPGLPDAEDAVDLIQKAAQQAADAVLALIQNGADRG